MTTTRKTQFPVGASVTLDELQNNPYPAIARLRATEPVSWIPAFDGWFITSRRLAVEAMRDAERLTVDDPRFSTAAVLGPSMLSVEGAEHDRHRAPFAPSFRPAMVREQFDDFLADEATRLIAAISAHGRAELRSAVAGPLAVNTITRFLGLDGVTPHEVLGWYTDISDAIAGVTRGEPIPETCRSAVREIGDRVTATIERGADALLRDVQAHGGLRNDELGSATIVLMFGAIETSEAMIANLLWHLLQHPDLLAQVRADRTLVAAAIEESLRLEPAAAVVDRYTTADVQIGGIQIPKGDLVSVSLLGANRDGDVFDDPDVFRLGRSNIAKHVAFVHGPHACVGLHLARLETVAALSAVLDGCPDLVLDSAASTAPSGLIFRKPDRLVASWAPTPQQPERVRL
jgi:cytochrome P450